MRFPLVSNPAKSGLYRFGSFEFDPQSGEPRKQGIRVRLEGQPLTVLAILIQRPQRSSYTRRVAEKAVAGLVG
jgi:DNA-binding response OmpR family regulator